MKNATNAAPYPHINTQPAYREAMDKLEHFSNQLKIEQDNLVELQSEHVKSFAMKKAGEGSDEDTVKDAEALIAAAAARPLVELIGTKTRLIKALEVAVRAQRSAVGKVVADLSRVAGEQNRDQHKETVRRLAAAVQELHDANKAESDFRSSLEKLGYEGALLPMQMLGVDDPDSIYGGIAYHWMRDARQYFMTNEEQAAAQEAAEAKVHRDSLALKLRRRG